MAGLPRELKPSNVTWPTDAAGRSTAIEVPVADPERESTNDTVLGGAGSGVVTEVDGLAGDACPAVSRATTV